MTKAERVVIRAIRNRWTMTRVELHVPLIEAFAATERLLVTGRIERGPNGWLYLKGQAPTVMQKLTWRQRLLWWLR